MPAHPNGRCRIVVTGGPGGGKTTAADLFRREIGERVVIVPEAATMIFSGGFPRCNEEPGVLSAQHAIYHVQRNLEDVQSARYPDRILLCDRGTVDGAAYWPGAPDAFFDTLGTTLELELARYDGVIFFESAAVGGIGIEGGNPVRTESMEQAVALDARLHNLWAHHSRFVLVRHNPSFFKKISFGLAELDSMVHELSVKRGVAAHKSTHAHHSVAVRTRAAVTTSTEVRMFKQLLVPVDGSRFAEQALGPAAAIARHTGARIDIVRVHEPSLLAGLLNASADQNLRETEHAHLEALAAEVSSGAAIATTHALLTGKVSEMINARASDLKADLIVMTSHGRTGLSRAWLGSVADELIRHTNVPVLMLRSQSRKEDRELARSPFRRILVLLDGSKDSEEILSAATTLAASHNADLVLLRVVQPLPLSTAQAGSPFGMPDVGIPSVLAVVEDLQATEENRAAAMHELRQVASQLDLGGAARIETHVMVAEQIAEGITEFAVEHDIDAIAMCSHGRGASRLLMGSVAEKVLRATHLPILLYRPARAWSARA